MKRPPADHWERALHDQGSSQPSLARRLCLKDKTPLAGGSTRLIYQHPDFPDLLVKIERSGERAHRWYKKKRRRYGYLRRTVREIQEYLAAEASPHQPCDLIERVAGLAETDLGTGLVVERLQDRDGNLAPTLGRLVREERFNADLARDLQTFLERVLSSDIIVSDITPANIVLAHDRPTGTHRFVLVDGLGEKMFIPLNSWFPSFNRRNKKRHVEKLHRLIDETRMKVRTR